MSYRHLDVGQYIVRRERLGVPQSARDVFALLATNGWLDQPLTNSLQRMVGFRNLAVHGYQALQIVIVVRIIQEHLDELLRYGQTLLRREAHAQE